ncbi:energy-coupling factor transporter ATP-binding protein EcfA2 [Saccharothrix tamanrassetensis]|uniref:Energy-coupling factor transporter ATP-binding protein EcfA2 n=1 Tax=Saccharothrix tamanrassetensis TaxID=1051531 RepID=A0A841CJZ7_9PSEU|nr:hypothetical protein [Saccharothrix tamanrassetensis]MBB5955956.1 energy-coupling factor transporter ATP-binding protein EcfA2 [Saccharothrix tamanrassetensis]
MEIHAQRVGVTGPHGPLLKPTGLRVPPGELVLVAGPPGAGHTAFGLALSGRLRPSTGTVTPSATVLRQHVVLVDSPDVSEPEASLSLAGVVGEELAMNGRRSSRKAVADWLVARGVDEYLDTRFEYVPADVRCGLMLELAAGRPGARALILDTPDRYHGDPSAWWRLAREHVTPELSVVVLCTSTSAAALDVPAAQLGSDNTAAEVDGAEHHAGRHAAELAGTATVATFAPLPAPAKPVGLADAPTLTDLTRPDSAAPTVPRSRPAAAEPPAEPPTRSDLAPPPGPPSAAARPAERPAARPARAHAEPPAGAPARTDALPATPEDPEETS